MNASGHDSSSGSGSSARSGSSGCGCARCVLGLHTGNNYERPGAAVKATARSNSNDGSSLPALLSELRCGAGSSSSDIAYVLEKLLAPAERAAALLGVVRDVPYCFECRTWYCGAEHWPPEWLTKRNVAVAALRAEVEDMKAALGCYEAVARALLGNDTVADTLFDKFGVEAAGEPDEPLVKLVREVVRA